MTTIEPTEGSIVHVEFYSEDAGATVEFFEEVFGWLTDPVEGMDSYSLWRAPDPPGGGIMQRDPEGDIPAGTLFYIDVSDIEETRSRIREAGGEVLVEEMAVPEMGVFTIFRDPGGIVEAAWETRVEGGEPDEDTPVFTDDTGAGSITHFEFYSDDTEATRSFHEAVFGWTFESIDDDAYTMIRPPTPPTGGLMPATPELPTGSLVYLLVDDAAASCSAIEESRGRILREPFDVDGWGVMAVFEAPGNVVLAVWESVPESAERQVASVSSEKLEGQH